MKFWRLHGASIAAPESFRERHEVLLAAARSDLPLDPVGDPMGLLAAARTEAGVDRWPELLPPGEKLVAQYFPALRPWFAAALRDDTEAAP